MFERAILVHGYCISTGANLLSRRQADAAARAYLEYEGSLIVCPTGVAEHGEGPIGEFIGQYIEDYYPMIPKFQIQTLADPGVVSTKREFISALRFLQKTGINQVLDLTNPVHTPRTKWLMDDLKKHPPTGLNIGNFDIEFKTTLDYLFDDEKEELLNNPAQISFMGSEKWRFRLVRCKPLYYLVEKYLPPGAKSYIEAFQGAMARRHTQPLVRIIED